MTIQETILPALSTGAAHHPFGPSRWPALLECPHWEGKPTSPDAERGTALHELFARALLGEETGEPEDLFEEHVLRLAEKYRAMHLEEKGDLSEAEKRLLVEHSVRLDQPMGEMSDIFGRVDCAFMTKGAVLHVIDLKMAENPERDYLPQLIAYASGIAVSCAFDPVEIVFHVAYADSGKKLERRMPADEVWCRYEELFERIQVIASGEKGEANQCGWCALCAKQASCPATEAVAKAVTDRLADAPGRWAEFAPARKAQLCVIAEAVVKWGEAVKAVAAEDARNGNPIEDPENGIFYALQERKGRLVVEDVQTAWDLLKPHLTAGEYRGCLSVNQTALKSALKKKGMKAAEANAMLERCGTRLPPTTVFVRRGAKAGG